MVREGEGNKRNQKMASKTKKRLVMRLEIGW